jgi:hypothetical protein
MLYLFELMANASLSSVSSRPIKEPNVRSATVSGTPAVLPRFAWTKIGDIKMDRRDQELLDTQMRRLMPPRHEGVIALMLAAMFLVGMTLGSVLSAHQSEPIQIASMD